MRDLRRASVVVAVLAGTAGLVCIASAGCGTTVNGETVDAATDGPSKDGRVVDSTRHDVTPGHDALPDVGRDAGRDSGHDTGHDVGHDTGHDTGHDVGHDVGHDTGHDTGHETGHDTGHDVGHDTGHDTGHDAGHDAGYDANYDAGHDAGWDVSGVIAAFQVQVSQAYCERFFQCCGSNPTWFSVESCTAYFESNEGAFANVGNIVPNSGHVEYVPSAASNCYTAIAVMPCVNFTAAELVQITADCQAAVQGTLTVGETGCESAWDCVQPAYCAGGQCAALLPMGGVCTDAVYSQDCNPLGNGSGTFCGPYGASPAHCLVAEGDGGICEEDQQCMSTMCATPCGSNWCCSSSATYFIPDGGPEAGNNCYWFPPVDAG